MNPRVVRNRTNGVFEHVEKTHEMPSGWCEHQPRSPILLTKLPPIFICLSFGVDKIGHPSASRFAQHS